jgi:hypothetical protein
MPNRRGSYPYPLLDAGDDVHSTFDVSQVAALATVGSVNIDFRIELTDEDLWRYIANGDASMVVRWRCAPTFKLGQMIPTEILGFGQARQYSMQLSQDDVTGRVQLEFQIVAKRSIANYQLAAQSEDYGANSFAIRAGDVLAIAGSTEISPDKAFDPMKPPLESCFEIVQDPSVVSGIFVDWERDESVIVRVAPTTFAQFATLSGQPKFQVAAVMLPALMATLEHLREEDNQAARDTDWGRSVLELCARRGVEGMNSLMQAQAILEDPIGQAVFAESSAMGESE